MNWYFFKSKKFITWAVIGGFVYGLIMVIGATVYDFLPVDFRFFSKEQIWINLKFFLQNLFLFLVMLVLMCLVSNRISASSKSPLSVKNPKAVWWLAPAVFLCYLIVYLAYFPGITGYDSYMQIPQALGAQALTNHHPVLHTLFLRLCLWGGSFFSYEGAGLVLYSVISMLLASIGITYSVFMLGSKVKNPIVLVLSGLWFALYPTFSLLSFSVNKDMLFSVAFVLFAERLYLNIFDADTERRQYAEVILWGLLSCLLRNNAVYGLAVVAIVLLFLKNSSKKNALCVLITVCISFSITHFVYPALSIAGSPVQESKSIPIQQISSVYYFYYDELNEEIKNTIETYIPEAAVFNASTVDYVKVSFNGSAYKEDSSLFWKTWIKLGLQHPWTYMKYGILLNLESWLPQYNFKDPSFHSAYVNTEGPESFFGTARNSVFPKLTDFYEQYGSFSHPWMEMPVIGFLFSCSLPFVFLFVSLIYLLATGNYKPILFLLPFILFWLTHLLGPLCNIRYFLSILLMMPIAMIIISEPKEATD